MWTHGCGSFRGHPSASLSHFFFFPEKSVRGALDGEQSLGQMTPPPWVPLLVNWALHPGILCQVSTKTKAGTDRSTQATLPPSVSPELD